jgi:hypothetical protein
MTGNRSLFRLIINYGARDSECLASGMSRLVRTDGETLDGILQDLLDAGWELKGSIILAYVSWIF